MSHAATADPATVGQAPVGRAQRSPAGPGRPRDHGSRTVDLLRVVLPAIALALVALVVAWPQLIGTGRGLIAPILDSVEIAATDVMLMHNPRYLGETENAEPYEVVAEAAHLDPDAPHRIHLEHLVAKIDKSGDRDLRLAALSGIYNRKNEKLELDGGIVLTTSDGYRFETESARINLGHSRVAGNQPIVGSGPSGTLEADRFEIKRGGDLMRFRGRVKVTVNMAKGD
jgi:lipopolysaccharide export system protein LptC